MFPACLAATALPSPSAFRPTASVLPRAGTDSDTDTDTTIPAAFYPSAEASFISGRTRFSNDIRIEMPLEACDPHDTSPRGFLATVRSQGFVRALTELIAPIMAPGAAGKAALDATGLFNVNQLAINLATGIPGVSGKYGIQVNLVKPDIAPLLGNYYLQVFPVHDEIGFDLPATFTAFLPPDTLPSWCGLSAQIVRNHGVNIPLVHGDAGWALGGPEDGAAYLEEWVIRPTEVDLKYLQSPVQCSIGLELGAHFKWALNNPNLGLAVASNVIANGFGMAAGAAVSMATGGNLMLAMQGGAMVAQLGAHGMQCWSNVLCPDEILTWAGVALGPVDVNGVLPPQETGRLTNYARVWGHVHGGVWHLHRQAEAAIAPLTFKAIDIAAIELAERGLDHPAFCSDAIPGIAARYAAQYY